jgi:hypothetical protein
VEKKRHTAGAKPDRKTGSRTSRARRGRANGTDGNWAAEHGLWNLVQLETQQALRQIETDNATAASFSTVMPRVVNGRPSAWLSFFRALVDALNDLSIC